MNTNINIKEYINEIIREKIKVIDIEIKTREFHIAMSKQTKYLNQEQKEMQKNNRKRMNVNLRRLREIKLALILEISDNLTKEDQTIKNNSNIREKIIKKQFKYIREKIKKGAYQTKIKYPSPVDYSKDLKEELKKQKIQKLEYLKDKKRSVKKFEKDCRMFTELYVGKYFTDRQWTAIFESVCSNETSISYENILCKIETLLYVICEFII